ncbi:MAG: hypothetical protein QM811_13710 [Pirellulales bacterium]
MNDPKPSSYVLAATDGEKYFRSHSQEIPHRLELRCDGTSLLLTHLGIPLIRVPWTGPEPEIFFEGRGVLYGLSLTRTSDEATETNVFDPPIAKNIRPSEAAWNETVLTPSSRLTKNADGSVELYSGDRNEKGVWSTFPSNCARPA